jgi:hypothetical protein
MFPLDFPMSILKDAREGVVVDPFCGRGTTNLVARLRGLPTVAVDSSPVAIAATAAKLSCGTISPKNIVTLARDLIAETPNPAIPQGDFWGLAYHHKVLHSICSIREGLLRSCLSDTAKALRGIMLGALHGPKHKSGSSSYFSNQSPRTFGPKPAYAVKFWRERDLKPPLVDVLKIIENRAQRAYRVTLPPVRSVVQLSDSREVCWSSLLRDLGPIHHVVTSPPYYGLRTYRPDQWLREWFLGGTKEVCYTADAQVSHASHDRFAADLGTVWRGLANHAAPGARLVIRFGAINDRPIDPEALIKTSLAGTNWRVVYKRSAGGATNGRRQVVSFRGNVAPAIDEVDVFCKLVR